MFHSIDNFGYFNVIIIILVLILINNKMVITCHLRQILQADKFVKEKQKNDWNFPFTKSVNMFEQFIGK